MTKPIFIIGPPRSGTTLVAEVLNQHPDICITLETHFFEEIFPLINTIDFSRKEQARQFASKVIETNIRHLSSEQVEKYEMNKMDPNKLGDIFLKRHGGGKDILEGYLSYRSSLEGGAIIGEKTPKHTFYLTEIFNLYETPRIIFVVRNGLDFLASYKQKHGPNRPKDNPELYHPVVTSYMWRKSIQNIVKYLGTPSTIRVQYEKFVNNPQEQIEILCDFLKLSFNSTMLEPGTDNSTYKTAQSETEIHTKSIGRWKNVLNNSEVQIFRHVSGHISSKLGHDVPKITGTFSKLIYHYLSTPFSLMQSLLSKNPDFLTRYVNKRLNNKG